MAKQSIGLVLRSKSVEAFQAVKGWGGTKLVKFVSVPLDGTDDISVSEAIRQAVVTAGVKSGRVAVSVPSQDIILRAFTLPLLPKAEWTNAVQFEARKYIPFKMEELVWGYYALEQRAAKQLAVTFAGIRTDRLGQIRRWLSLAGVKPSLVEAQAISLARLAGQTPQGMANQFIGIVDIDRQANTAHIVIAKHHVPYLSRDIVLKAEPAAAPSPEDLPSRSAAPEGLDARVEILLSELRLSFDFFIREHPKAIISQVYLFGEEEFVAPWATWLAQQLPCPVLLGKVAGLVRGMESFGVERAAAAGLALGELASHPVRLDFLVPPTSYVSRATQSADFLKAFSISPEDGQAFLRALMLQAGTAALALGVVFGATQFRLGALRQEAQRAIRAFPQVGHGLDEQSPEELEAARQVIDHHLEFLRQAVVQRVPVTEKLNQLAQTLPDGVWLEGLEYDDRLDVSGSSQHTLRLRGSCYLGGNVGEELSVVSEFVRNLKQDSAFFRGFSIAQLSEISKAHDTQTGADYQTFHVVCDSTGS